MTRNLRLLLIEDSADDAELLLMEIRREFNVDFEQVETFDAMQAALTSKTWDLVVCDYSLPQFNAPRALEIMQAGGQDQPFIIVSGTINEETAVAALKAGAHDFIIKGKYARLIPAIERELREAEIRLQRRRADEALKEKDHLLSEAQRISRIGSWSYDLASDTLQYSDEIYRLLDVSPHAFNHNTEGFLLAVYPLDRVVVSKWLETIKAGNRVRELTFRLLRSNGELRYLNCTGEVVYDNHGKLDHLVGTLQDVTERKLAEIQIQQQVSRLTALRTIDRAITSSLDLHIILETVLSQVLVQLQVDAADILLLDPEEEILKYAAARGFRTQAVNTAQVRLGDSLAGRAAKEHHLIRIENLREKPGNLLLSSLLAGEDFVCYFGVPLVSKGNTKGVLEVFHRMPLQPYPEWLDFLNALAEQAAIAIDNATLFEKLQLSNSDLNKAYDETIEGWSRALDLRDKETEGHTQRVTEITLRLAPAMNFSGDELIQIRRGALLHDIGKMGVPDKILLKEGPLSEEEWTVMRKHPQFAYDLLVPINYLRQALEIPYCHHEKWDGTGYPRELKGEQIPLSARIFAIADVWDALTSDRPYRPAWSVEKSLAYIHQNSGKHFDPQVVELFLKLIPDPNRS